VFPLSPIISRLTLDHKSFRVTLFDTVYFQALFSDRPFQLSMSMFKVHRHLRGFGGAIFGTCMAKPSGSGQNNDNGDDN